MTTTVKKYDYRCPHCGRLAFRARLTKGTVVSHRCAKCGKMLTFESNGQGKTNVMTEEKTAK